MSAPTRAEALKRARKCLRDARSYMTSEWLFSRDTVASAKYASLAKGALKEASEWRDIARAARTAHPAATGVGEEPLVVTQVYVPLDEAYAFGELRWELNLRPCHVQEALGITYDQWCDLEAAVATCDWSEAERRLRAYAAARKEAP